MDSNKNFATPRDSFDARGKASLLIWKLTAFGGVANCVGED
jgi:hypothetical protein